MKWHLPRRTFLRGAGALIALPLLNGMLNESGTALAGNLPLPKRFGVWFFGNGTQLKRWVPADTGDVWQLSDALSPLGEAGLKDYISVVSGTDVLLGTAHPGGTAGVLCGTAFDNDTQLPRGASIDQLVAPMLSADCAFRSLELGVSDQGINSYKVSFNGNGSQNYPECDPAKVFDRLFGGGSGGDAADRKARQSVLDAVTADARALSTKLGATDKARLDEHLTGIRMLEQRLKGTASTMNVECAPMAPAAITGTTGFTEHNKIMSELLATALACDLSRVFSYMFTEPASWAPLPEVNINEGFHGVFHNDTDDNPSPDVHRGVVYEMARLADTLRALQAVPEGDGNLLDNCVIMATTCNSEGKNHHVTDYPILVAGHGGGALKSPGKHLRALGEPTSRVPLTLARAAGANLDSFGESTMYTTALLDGLLA